MDILKLDQLVFHPWVAQTPRNVPAFVSGEGSFLVDHTGRRYLDFSSQLVFTNVGHQHPRVVSATCRQRVVRPPAALPERAPRNR